MATRTPGFLRRVTDALLVEKRLIADLKSNEIIVLLGSYIDGDDEKFLSIALQVAAQEARAGRKEEADKLKRLVQNARDQGRAVAPAKGQTPISMARPRGELQGLVDSAYPKTKLDSMVLANDVRLRLEHFY